MSTPPYGPQDPSHQDPEPPQPHGAPAPGSSSGGTVPLPSDPYDAPAPPPGAPYTEPTPPGYGGTPPLGQPPAYGQEPVLPPGYGQQPPAYYGQQRPPSERKGLAIAALVLGILALLGFWVPFLNIGSMVLGAVGLVLGIVALVQISKGTAGGRGMAITGAALSVAAIVLSIVVTVIVLVAFENNAPFWEQQFQEELDRQMDELEQQGY